jgi:Family of unknown function (DUF5706)
VSSPALDDLPDRAWKIFDGVSARIELADAKAGLILGVCGVASATILGLVASHHSRGLPLLIAVITSGVFVLLAAACSCATLWPRRLRRDLPSSLVYFDHVARSPDESPATYANALRGLLSDPEALTREIAEQIWATSHVASGKYNWLNRALVSLFAAIAGLGVAAVIFAVS